VLPETSESARSFKRIARAPQPTKALKSEKASARGPRPACPRVADLARRAPRRRRRRFRSRTTAEGESGLSHYRAH
jgi:hypothetical protein